MRVSPRRRTVLAGSRVTVALQCAAKRSSRFSGRRSRRMVSNDEHGRLTLYRKAAVYCRCPHRRARVPHRAGLPKRPHARCGRGKDENARSRASRSAMLGAARLPSSLPCAAGPAPSLGKWWRQRGSNPHSLSLPGAPSGLVYSESHGAERYNSRSSHMRSISFRSRRRRNPVKGKVLATECGACHVDRYISRPARPVHPLALGICCARLNQSPKGAPVGVKTQGCLSVLHHAA